MGDERWVEEEDELYKGLIVSVEPPIDFDIASLASYIEFGDLVADSDMQSPESHIPKEIRLLGRTQEATTVYASVAEGLFEEGSEHMRQRIADFIGLMGATAVVEPAE